MPKKEDGRPAGDAVHHSEKDSTSEQDVDAGDRIRSLTKPAMIVFFTVLAAALTAFFAREGIDRADKYASILGLFTALAGLLITALSLGRPAGRTGPSPRPSSSDSSAESPGSVLSRRFIGLSVSALGAIIVLGAVMYGVFSSKDLRPSDPATAASTTSAQLEPSAANYVIDRSGPQYVKLRHTPIPQNNFDPRTWSYTDNNVQGVTFECRMKDDREKGCTAGHEPVFLIDPVEPGATIARVGGTRATQKGCPEGKYQPDAVPVAQGETYCVQGDRWCLMIDVVVLPPAIVGSDTVFLETHVEYRRQL